MTSSNAAAAFYLMTLSRKNHGPLSDGDLAMLAISLVILAMILIFIQWKSY